MVAAQEIGCGEGGGVRALILAPTKELAEQIHREAMLLSTGKRIKIALMTKKLASNAVMRQVRVRCKSVESSVQL